MAISRGCGTRVQGGVYAVGAQCDDARNSLCHPWQEFLVDPPQMIDPKRLGLSHIGTSLMGNKLFDWIGEKYYPNVADLIEETCFVDPATGHPAGVSRRIGNPESDEAWKKLTRDTLLVLVHSRGMILNALDYMDRARSDNVPVECTQLVGKRHCGRELKAHVPEVGMCACLWWQDIEPGKGVRGVEDQGPEVTAMRAPNRRVVRGLPGGSYVAYARPDGVIPMYATAVIARFPLKLEVVKDPRGSHEETVRRIMMNTDVSVKLVNA